MYPVSAGAFNQAVGNLWPPKTKTKTEFPSPGGSGVSQDQEATKDHFWHDHFDF